jgi:hypothetical protein
MKQPSGSKKMRSKSFIQFTIAAMLLGASLTPVIAADAVNPNSAKAQQMIEKAEAARKQASSVGGEWRDTADLIEQAKTTLAKGDTVAAMKLAAEAHKQGVLGYQQAVSQQQLHMPPYLKY